MKKRISQLEKDITLILPLSALPVKLSWDSSLFQEKWSETPLLTSWFPGYRFDVAQGDYWRPFIVRLSETSSYTLNFDKPGYSVYDSLRFLTYIPDSTGQQHPYVHFFVCIGFDMSVSNEEQTIQTTYAKVLPNPISDYFSWETEFPVKEWKIYSLTGKILKRGNASLKEFYCGNWPNGLYIFVAYDQNNKPHPVKFVKQ